MVDTELFTKLDFGFALILLSIHFWNRIIYKNLCILKKPVVKRLRIFKEDLNF